MLKKQSGSVMIVTLWTLALLTILIAALAGQTRLSAAVVYFHQQELQRWADVTAAINQAEMELMLERQPLPVFNTVDDPEELDDDPLYRFNGDELQLYYPQAAGIKVRIFDHAGKINLREVSRQRLRALLEKLLGEDEDQQISNMIEAWSDWQDLNDQATRNGAEKDYYAELELPYVPRNGQFETVEEILQIKGFAEVFEGINLDAAFTLYGENELVNLNLATVEAMRLLPGLDEELIRDIVTWRQDNEFRGNGDVAQLVPAENMAVLRGWINSRKKTNYYTIMVYSEEEGASSDDEFASKPLPLTAYAETVQVDGSTRRPKILKINPYQLLPLSFDDTDVE